jgi:phosphoribosylformylglycinamidine synthase PurS subunit
MWPQKGGFRGHIADLATGQRCRRDAGEMRVTGAGSGPRGRPGIVIGVSRVIVDVVLKPEISDPQGQAVLGALGRLGHDGVTSVRQGKHFVLEVDGTPDEAELKQIAETLLANPVIEDVELHITTD